MSSMSYAAPLGIGGLLGLFFFSSVVLPPDHISRHTSAPPIRSQMQHKVQLASSSWLTNAMHDGPRYPVHTHSTRTHPQLVHVPLEQASVIGSRHGVALATAAMAFTGVLMATWSVLRRNFNTAPPPVPEISLMATSGILVSNAREAINSYMQDVAGLPPPILLGGLLESLHRKGHGLVVDPASFRKSQGLHPLLIPLSVAGDGSITCLLRRLRDESGEDLSVVITRGGPTSGMLPIARTVTEAVRRACAEADAAGNSELLKALIDSCDAGPRLIYVQGEDKGLMGRYGVEKYVTLKIGTFPDLCEGLIESHLGRGDKTSAMVVCEKMNRDLTNIGWTQLRQAQLMRRLEDNRPLEIRDCARLTLHLYPSWSLGLDSRAAAAELLGFSEGGVPSETDGTGVMLQTVEQLGLHKANKSRDLQLNKLNQNEISPQQVAYERAGYLLDAVALGAGGYEHGWVDEEFLKHLAELCETAGLKEVAHFIRS